MIQWPQSHSKTPLKSKLRGLISFGLSAVLFAIFTHSADALASAKTDALAHLKEWRERTIELSKKAEETQRRALKSLSVVRLNSEKQSPTGSSEKETLQRNVVQPLDDIESADIDRMEHAARIKIIDQIIFAVDTKFGAKAASATLTGFLQGQLLDLASNDLTEPGIGQWWRFLTQAAIALREIAEPSEDPIRFLESYTRSSTVLNPRSVIDIMESRRYVGE